MAQRREEEEKENRKKQIMQMKKSDLGNKQTEDLFIIQQKLLLEKQKEFEIKEELKKKNLEAKRAQEIKLIQIRKEKVREKIQKTMANNDLILKLRREVFTLV